MNKSILSVLLVLVDVLLGFAILCVVPFAWTLRDGLGPDSVPTSGVTAISKASMTFYIGPVILFLVLLEILPLPA